jgi:hypothetical protein
MAIMSVYVYFIVCLLSTLAIVVIAGMQVKKGKTLLVGPKFITRPEIWFKFVAYILYTAWTVQVFAEVLTWQ